MQKQFSAVTPELAQALAIQFFIGFALTVFCLPLYIRFLRAKKANQYLRDEGPKSHAGKANTPTTGGLCFILATTAGVIIAPVVDPKSNLGSNFVALFALAGGIACALVGLTDDLAKIRNQANKGISAKSRLNAEATLGFTFGVLAFILLPLSHLPTPYLLVPHALFDPLGRLFELITMAGPVQSHFANLIGIELPLVVLAVLAILIFTATTNAVNLHDGMDGLASGTSLLVLLTMAIMLLHLHTDNHALVMLCLTSAGAIFGFLLFNRYPARIFMGDTGSLFIDVLMAAIALCGGLSFWFIPLAGIYVLEAFSVILQFSYFRLTKPFTPPKPIKSFALAWVKLTRRLPGEGKRLFRMAPIHHHFEAVLAERGFREWQVVLGFWVVQLILCLGTVAAFFNS